MELYGQELVESVTDDGIFDGVYSNITGALSDGCGNMCMPLAAKEIYPDVTATRLQRIDQDNVRAYTSALPTRCKWIDGAVRCLIGDVVGQALGGYIKNESALLHSNTPPS